MMKDFNFEGYSHITKNIHSRWIKHEATFVSNKGGLPVCTLKCEDTKQSGPKMWVKNVFLWNWKLSMEYTKHFF